MELRHLRYFVAVAEELHFGRAAQRLGISQPPLSQQIKDLEVDIGAPLLTRNKHSVTLTVAGEAALTEAYKVLEQADRLRAVARQANAGVGTRLSIGCVSSALFDILPPILKRLHAQHPEIGISVQDQETSTATRALLEEKLDAAFIRVGKVQPPLTARLLTRDFFIVALPGGHALAKRKAVPFASLANEPLIVYTRRMDPRTHDRIITGCLKEGFRPNVVYQSPSIQSQIGMVACGLGIAILPNPVRHWRIPGVAYRPLSKPIEAASVSIVWHKRRRSAAVELLLAATQHMFP